ncbi:hypothetical protein L596_010201 [Steinernema carpocapsae]|uniref:Uncharacterized protein n=1 Tax=Steinernema carpocapsae TaxID=34508 RepID=A0A4U5PHU9_STECR|nr:hypothetical protein L596_010201 [Steinernema carpocapsae]
MDFYLQVDKIRQFLDTLALFQQQVLLREHDLLGQIRRGCLRLKELESRMAKMGEDGLSHFAQLEKRLVN